MMKKLLVLAVVAGLMSVAVVASADSENAAEVFIRDTGCGIAGAPISYPNVQVNTNNGNGNGTLVCRGSGYPNETGRPLVFDIENYPRGPGFECGTSFGFTDRWRAVISPSGQVALTCHFPATN